MGSRFLSFFFLADTGFILVFCFCFCFVLPFPGIVLKKHMTEDWQAFFNDICKVYLSAIQCLNSWSLVYFKTVYTGK